MNYQEQKQQLAALRQRAGVLLDDIHLAHEQAECRLKQIEKDPILNLTQYTCNCNIVDALYAAEVDLTRAVRALEKALAAVDKAEAAMAPAGGGGHEEAH
jgi:hypothetical protein